MARPPQGQQQHPGRQLAVLGLIFVVLYSFALFGAGASGSITERLQPKLGLDLIGGTQATYQASLLTNGQVPSQTSMEEARKIIESRVNALGVSEAEVVIEGNRNIVVSLAGEADDQLKNVGQAAQMRFRKVLNGDRRTWPPPRSNPPSAVPSAAPERQCAGSGRDAVGQRWTGRRRAGPSRPRRARPRPPSPSRRRPPRPPPR